MERQVSSLAGGLLDMATTVEEIRRVTATGNLDGILDSSENALE
jgi:hypothetical protein